MELHTLADRKPVAEELLRLKSDKMSPAELDLAMALLLHKTIRLSDTEEGAPVEVLEQGTWRRFSPTQDWADYGEVVSAVELVQATHACYDDAEDSRRVTGYRFSCHGYVSGTDVQSRDGLRVTVGRCCARLLAHHVEFSERWGNT